MSLELEPFSLPLAAPLATASGRIERREGFLVRATVEGERGLGEATPLDGWTESLADCRAALEAVEDPRSALDSGALADQPAARHGLALAVADARARADGVSLARHIGGDASVETVPANATVGDRDAAGVAAAAREAAADGFTALKVKVGARSLAADVARLRAAREGFDGELRADANGAWDRETARDALSRFAALDVAYVEQPLRAADLAGHTALRRTHRADLADPADGVDGPTVTDPVGVALDESLARHPLDAALSAGAADAVVLKPMVLGGLDRARAAALRAREADVTAVVTTTVDGAVARAGAVHLAASLPSPPACGLATGDRLAADLLPSDPAPVVDGAVRVPRGPGNVDDPARSDGEDGGRPDTERE